MSGKLDATEQIIAASRSLGSGAAPQPTHSKVWQRLIDGTRQFSVEQVESANRSEEVNAALSVLLREHTLCYLFKDTAFCESELYRPLCDKYIDEFLKAASTAKSSLADENAELKKQVAELQAAAKKKGGKSDE